MRRLLSLLLFTALALVAASVPAAAGSTTVLDQGHVDVFGVAYEDGELHLHVHAEENDAEYEPHEVLLVAKPESRTTVPDDPAFAFLGTPGSPVWILPEIEDPNLLFAGIAAEEVEPGVFVNDALQIKVLAAYGPDDLSIFTVGVSGPTVLVDTGNGLPDAFTVPAGAHVHANWAFEAPGNYYLAVQASGTLAATGERVRSDIAVYQFKVQR